MPETNGSPADWPVAGGEGGELHVEWVYLSGNGPRVAVLIQARSLLLATGGGLMRYLIATVLMMVAVIHLLPLSGVLGAERLAALYGISAVDPSLVILLRHRAVLFGLLGVFLILAAFRPALWNLALSAASVSVVSFIVLAWSVGGYNAHIASVVTVDLVALVLLAVGAGASVIMHMRR